MADYYKWLVEGLKKSGKSQAGLARHLGVSQSVGNRIAGGTRPLKLVELPKVASYIEEPIPSEGVEPTDLPAGHTLGAPVFAPVLGRVADGVWIDEVMSRSAETLKLAIAAHPDYPADAHYLLEAELRSIDDPSVERRYYVCIPIEILDRKVRADDRVHIELRRAELIQRTVRVVRRIAATLVLVALDAQPNDVPLSFADVELVGLVVGMQVQYRV